MNRISEYITKSQSALPLDIRIDFYDDWGKDIWVCSKEFIDRVSPITNFSMTQYCNLDSILGITQEEVDIITRWKKNNDYLILIFLSTQLAFEDFVSLMFKGNEYPTKEQIEFQHMLIDILVKCEQATIHTRIIKNE